MIMRLLFDVSLLWAPIVGYCGPTYNLITKFHQIRWLVKKAGGRATGVLDDELSLRGLSLMIDDVTANRRLTSTPDRLCDRHVVLSAAWWPSNNVC
ncbi:hypothetical protein V1520DRAFT_336220 [Lipomyces starkeyi]